VLASIVGGIASVMLEVMIVRGWWRERRFADVGVGVRVRVGGRNHIERPTRQHRGLCVIANETANRSTVNLGT
jgi:hypothetical protein